MTEAWVKDLIYWDRFIDQLCEGEGCTFEQFLGLGHAPVVLRPAVALVRDGIVKILTQAEIAQLFEIHYSYEPINEDVY